MSTQNIAAKKRAKRAINTDNMIQELLVPCIANGNQKKEVKLFIGNADHNHSPTHFQEAWLEKERGMSIPQEITEGLQKIRKLAIENGVPFTELCEYAIKSLNGGANKSVDTKDKSKNGSATDDGGTTNNGQAN